MIYLASDHAGHNLKSALMDFLLEEGYEVVDLGAHEYDESDDYPDCIYPAAYAVAEDPQEHRGIVIGGSGQGEAIVSNRVPGVRAAVFYGPRMPEEAVDAEGRESEDAYEIVLLSRLHNDANILSIGARFVSEEEAKKAVRIFLTTEFSDAERHQRRIKKIDLPE